MLATLLLAGCDDGSSGGPHGSGNVVVVDVDATNQPAQAGYDASADSPYAPVDGSYGTLDDSAAPFAACTACGCEGGFCFGGGGGYAVPSGACTGGLGASSGGITPGCMPLPAACAATPDCNCLFAALSSLKCYPACNATNGLIVYCPP